MILFLPESRPGFGSGHARRSFEAAMALRDQGFSVGLTGVDLPRLDSLRRLLTNAFEPAGVAEFLTDKPAEPDALPADTEMVVFDSPEVDLDDLRKIRLQALAVGLDAGGAGREECDYLVDTLPRLKGSSPANYFSTALLNLPHRRQIAPPASTTSLTHRRGPAGSDGAPGSRGPEILVTFGGEDSRGLTQRALGLLLRRGIEPERIAVTLPAVTIDAGEETVGEALGPGHPTWLPPAVGILRAPGKLREELYRFPRVITAFGLTAFEAEAAGADVLLMHPSAYHRRLAARAGFCSLTSAEGRRRLAEPAPEPLPRGSKTRPAEVILPATREFPTDDSTPEWLLPAFLGGVKEAGHPQCPVCGQAANPVLARQEGRTHYRCRSCTMVFAHRFQDSGISYDGAYFFEEYQAQYGRSYVEDLPGIIQRGRERLDFIEASTGLRPPASVLDLGCAFGAFLTALGEGGYSAFGVDVSAEAIEYCRAHGHPEVWAGDLRTLSSEAPFAPSTFDLVTLWFVIEHFPDLRLVLESISSLVTESPDAGLLAFSTPNLAGVSGRKNLGAFLRASPGDHATVWSPKIAEEVLPRFGFEVVATRVTGHHPERIPGFRWLTPGSIFWNVMAGVSRVLRLGDTFEVVARKTAPERGGTS